MGADLRGILRLLLGTAITPRGATAGQIVGRKLAKKLVRSIIHDREEKHRKHGMESGAIAEMLDAGVSKVEDIAHPTGATGIASLADDLMMLRSAARKTMKGQVKKEIRRMDEKDEEKKKAAEVHPVLAKLALINFIAKAAAIEKEAPFKSEAQRRKFYAMKSRGEISGSTVKEWESHTPKGKKLPERVHKKEAIGITDAVGVGAWLKGVPYGAAFDVVRGTAEAGKKKPVSFAKTTVDAADLLIGLTKEAMFQTLKNRATANMGKAVGGKVIGEASPKGREMSGAMSAETPSMESAGGGAHINRPGI